VRTWGRKALIYLVTFAGLIPVGFYMATENYSTLTRNIVILSIGFFAGNAVEHIAGAFKK